MAPNTRFLPTRAEPGELSFGEMELASQKGRYKILGGYWGL